MRYFRTSAFKRLYKKLPADRQKAVSDALAALDEVFVLRRPIPGLGLKQLRGGIWEIRAGLFDRIVFSRSTGAVEFLALGSHDDIRRFLKRL